MPNYRSLIGGYFSSPDQAGKVNASIWSNNPGAINGNAAWVQQSPGFVKTEGIGGGNPIAVFETPEQGVALWVNLLRRYRDGGYKTVQQIVNHYGGGQDYSAYVQFVCGRTGLAPSHEINIDSDDTELIKFARTMSRYEAGVESPLSDEQFRYGFDLARGKKEAPLPKPIPTANNAPAPVSVGRPWWVSLIESLFGRKKPVAPVPTPEPAPLDFAGRVLAAMRRKGYPIDEGADVVNIVYVAGIDEDTGKSNANRINAFDDARIVLQVVNGVAKILGAWQATIETGVYYTEHPIAEDGQGAARITFDYHKEVWQVGLHRGQYEGLIQTGNEVSVYRDNNKDYRREGDKITTGWYGINQHHGGDSPRDNIGYHSAGCLVGRMIKGHQEFMLLIKGDKRYRANRAFKFSTTVLDTL